MIPETKEKCHLSTITGKMIENPDEKHSEWYRRQRKDNTRQQVQVELSKTHQGKRSEKEKGSYDHETYRGSGVECEPDGGEMTPSELSLRNVSASCERIARSDRMVPSLSISVYAFVFFLGRRIRHPSLSLSLQFFLLGFVRNDDSFAYFDI